MDRIIKTTVHINTEILISCQQKLIPNSPLQRAFSTAHTFFSQQKFLIAIERFDDVIKLDPAFIGGHIGKGLSYMGLDDPGMCDKAIQCFDAAIAIDPLLVGLYTAKGMCFHYLGKLEEACDSYVAAMEINKKQGVPQNNEFLWVNLGGLYLRGAAESKSEPEAEKYLGLGQSAYRECLKINPKNAAATMGLGNFYMIKGMLDPAILFYRKADEMDPGHSRELDHSLAAALAQKACSLAEAGDLAGAAEYAKEAMPIYMKLKITDNNDVLCEIFINRASQILSAESDTRITTDKMLMQVKELADSALEIRSEGSVNNELLSGIMYQLGYVLLRRCYYRESTQCFEKTLKLAEYMHPDAAHQIHFLLGESYYTEKKYEDSIKSFKDFLGMCGNAGASSEMGAAMLIARLRIGTDLTEMGKYDEALAVFDEMLKHDEKDHYALERKANIYRILYDLENVPNTKEAHREKAVKLFENALERDQDCDYSKAMLSYLDGEFGAAISFLRKYIKDSLPMMDHDAASLLKRLEGEADSAEQE